MRPSDTDRELSRALRAYATRSVENAGHAAYDLILAEACAGVQRYPEAVLTSTQRLADDVLALGATEAYRRYNAGVIA